MKSGPSKSGAPLPAAALLRTGDSLLSAAQQEEYLALLGRAAPPGLACQQLGISLLSVARTLDEDAQFHASHERLQQLLSQNVAAALYRAAIEGNVSAQTFYLKNRPPPEWPAADQSLTPDELDELNDEELLDLFRQETAAILGRLPGESATAEDDVQS